MPNLPRRAEESGLVFRTADAIFASDGSFRIVQWNEAAQALLGFTKDDVLGKPCHELVGCPSLTRRLFCNAACREDFRPGPQELVPTFVTQIARKDGERICVEVATILTAPRKGPALRLHVLRDLTRQKAMEDLLRQVASGATRLSVVQAGAPDRSGNGNGNALARAPCSWAVTAREIEVIQLLAQGASTDAIASKLRITRRTARNHIQNLFAKLGVHSRVEAVAYASTKGLL